MIKVLLADNQSLVRAGFRRPLNSTDGITVVAEADDDAAVRRARDTGPDVVLMDVWMRGRSGLAAARRWRRHGPGGQEMLDQLDDTGYLRRLVVVQIASGIGGNS